MERMFNPDDQDWSRSNAERDWRDEPCAYCGEIETCEECLQWQEPDGGEEM